MVKNISGGNKAKGFSRREVNASSQRQSIRVSHDPLEVYVQVTKMSGGGICQVVTTEGTAMMCHIRGKFSGRNKRSNFIKAGSWLLVGMREWNTSSGTNGKKLECDVLEVYADEDKERLKSMDPKVRWSAFQVLDSSSTSLDDDDIVFRSEQADEFMNLRTSSLQSSTAMPSILEDEVIDINDI
jgi:translation initiation factor IF-1